jgi:hypothetical protein
MFAHFQTIIKISVMCLSRRQRGFESRWDHHASLAASHGKPIKERLEIEALCF